MYDNVEVLDAGKLDVDHMVPLAEAWDSGAAAWTDLKRQQYANDMTDPRHLIAVTGSSNRSKSDQDPADWVPTNKSYTCEYIANWVSIKVRWGLTIDTKEKAALIAGLKGCKSTKIVVIPLP
ncbi:MAG: HNH endonuclease family protein [Burkholderiales bacterium]|nr:HNH endonuclease family protein [Burkholderiales bacterium]